MKKQAQKISKLRILYTSALLLVMSASLLIVQSAVLINRSVFTTDTFSRTVTSSLTSESSRMAIASEVVERILADKPLARRVIGDDLTRLLAASLTSKLASSTLQSLSESIQLYMTTENQQSVTIELGSIKETITRLATVLDKDQALEATKISDIPSTIVIVDESKIPSLYGLGIIFMWMAPIATLLGVMAASFILYIYRKKIYLALYLIFGTLFFASIIGLVVGPLFKPPVLNIAKTINSRTVVANIYDAFTHLFTVQNYAVIYLSLSALAALFVLQHYKKFLAIVRTK